MADFHIFFFFSFFPSLLFAQYVYNNSYLVDSSSQFYFYWTADTTTQTLSVGLSVNTTGWVGFGISPNGGMVGADVFIAWVDPTSGQTYLNDRLAYEKSEPSLDVDNEGTEDWTLNKGENTDGILSIHASRLWDTKDKQDHPFTEGNLRLVFAWSPLNPAVVGSVQYHTGGRFPVPLLLWGTNQTQNVTFPPDTQETIIRSINITVPNAETTYYCTGFNIVNNGTKRQAIQFDPLITQTKLVHHMILYSCTTDMTKGEQPFSCEWMSDSCTDVMWAWAVGAGPFILPDEAGFPLGAGGYLNYVLLQIHYDNSAGLTDLWDNSGVRIYHTSTLRTNDAAFIRLGRSTKSISIPPKQSSYEIIGTCPSSSTQHIPDTGLTVIASLLHMHLRGRQIWTEIYRKNKFFSYLGQNIFYDFNFQQIQNLNPFIKLEANDELYTHCVYNTMNDNSPIQGGESSEDEMCFNYIAYYPKIENVASCINDGDDSATTKKKKILILVGAILSSIVGIIILSFIISKCCCKTRDSGRYGVNLPRHELLTEEIPEE